MAENNFSALVKLVVDKAQARSTLQRELKELQKDIELETGVKVNLSDIKQARKEIAQANKEQQEGTRENIKLRAQELAHTKMLAKETKAATDLELSSRERVRKLNDQTFKEESSARKKAIQETKLQAQEQKALIESLNTSEKKINRKIKNESYDTNIDKIKKQFQDYGLTVDQAEEKVSVLRSTLSEMQTLSGDSLIKKADEWEKAFADVKVQLDKTKLAYDQLSEVNEIQHSLSVGDYDVEVSTLTSKFQKWGLSVDEVDAKMKELNTSYNNLKNANTDDKRIQAEKEYQLALEKTNNELKLMSLNSASRTDRTNLSNKIQVWLDKNTKASEKARKTLQEYIVTLNKSDDIGVPALKNIKNEFAKIEIAERSAGRLGKSFTDTLKAGVRKFTEWGLASNAVMTIVSNLKKATTELKVIDTYLTEISKANDKLSKSDLAKIGDNSFDVASRYGKKASNYLSGIQEASRAGYENAEAIAELSVAIQGAGDVTEDVANSYVIATDKAYKLGGSVEALTEVFDGTNKINKNGLAI